MNEQSPLAQEDTAPSSRISGLAIASAVFGAFVLFQMGFALAILPKTLMAVTSVICGVIAVIQISRSGGSIKGKGLAVIGLVFSCCFLLIVLLFLVQNRMLNKSGRSDCLSNMKRIGLVISMYANQHDGKIPQGFDDLRPYATDLAKLLICPSAKDTSRPSYQIVLGGGKWDSIETLDAVVMAESPSNHPSGHNVLYGDGHVSWVLNEPNPR